MKNQGKAMLLNYLLENDFDVEEFLELIYNIESGKADQEEYEENPEGYDEEEMSFLIGDMEDWENEYNKIIENFEKEHPETNIKEEIEEVRKWSEKNSNL